MAITGYEGTDTIVNIPRVINGKEVKIILSFSDGVGEEKEKITKISIPNTVTEIRGHAFYGLENLTEVTIPSSITKIDTNTFEGCKSLTSIVIPNSIKEIGQYAFAYCTSLKSIVIPNSVEGIYYHAFFCCTSLQNVILSNSLTALGSETFHNCTSLKSITIPKKLDYLGDNSCGYYSNALSQVKKVPGFTIYGYYGTGAEAYAKANGFTFVGSKNSISDVAKINGIYDGAAVIYTGTEIKFPITVDSNLGSLKEGTDYKVTYTNNINAGTATITVTGINHYNGTIQKTFKIIPADLNAIVTLVTLSEDIFNYTGTEIRPIVTVVRYSDKKLLKEGSDYQVSYSDNINAGYATLSITGINNYKGTRRIGFLIKKASTSPTEQLTVVYEPTTIIKVPASVRAKVKKNKVTISWKKIKKTKKTKSLLAQIKGIEVQYSTDPSFPSATSVKVPLGKKKTKLVLKGLLPKTAYYVRVRYTDGAGGYSNWSKVKAFRTK